MQNEQTDSKPRPEDEPSRVEISYDVELYGKPVRILLPYVVGVMADLSGTPGEPLAPVGERRFFDVDESRFDKQLEAARPRVAFRVPDRLTGEGDMNVDITFECLADFTPTSVARKIPALSGLLQARGEVSSASPSDAEPGGLEEIDRKLAEQLNLVLHHEDFQRLEATWRGLRYLVDRTKTGSPVKVRALNVSKQELAATFERFEGQTWDQSPIFKRVCEDAYDTPGGEPFSVLVGDYYFSHADSDVRLLTVLAKIAAEAHAPFIAGAGAALMKRASWWELIEPPAPAGLVTGPEYEAWNELRRSEDSRYLALAVPRFLARAPYVAQAGSIEHFAFDEDRGSGGDSKSLWSNSAYLMAANIARAFERFHWPVRIRGVESGGKIDDLPVHRFRTNSGDFDQMCPMEVALTDRREAELAMNGLLPLSHWKNTDYAVFIGAQGLHMPAESDGEDARINEALAAGLPYMLAACRFAHYLKCIVRDKLGMFKGPKHMEEYLNNWLGNYVEPDAAGTGEVKAVARHPLASGEVRIGEEHKTNDGYYQFAAQFLLLPHYQVAGLTTPLRMTTNLPSVRRP